MTKSADRPKAIIPIAASNSFNWLVYGEPGVGKTTFAGTSPNALIVRAPTDNVDSLVASGSDAQQWIVQTWDDMNEVYEELRHNKDMFEWVWLDTLTLWQEFGLDDIMNDLVAAKPHRKVWQRDQGEIGQNMTRIGIWVRDMKALSFNFGVTCHVDRYEDDDRTLYRPQIQGRGMPERICGYMGLVGFLSAVKKEGRVERKLQTNKGSKYYAKDGYGAFGSYILDPTVPEMVEAIERSRADHPTPLRRTSQKRSKQ